MKRLGQEEARAASLAAEAQKKAEAAGASLEGFLGKAERFRVAGLGGAGAQKKAAEDAGASLGNLFGKAESLTTGISWDNLSSQFKSAVEKLNENEEPKVQVATVRGQAKARSLPSLKAVVKKPAPAPKPKVVTKPKPKEMEPKKEMRNVFGGLYKQETIYIDDD